MVDWDRVEQLRSKGWDWDRIATDEKVGFHPDASVRDPGRALRALYHRQRSRQGRRGPAPSRPSTPEKESPAHRWNLPRVGYLLTPIFGLWALFAWIAPSPVGLVLQVVPWLALALAVAAFILLFGLLRNPRNRWSPELRNTLVVGVVLGLLVSGVVGLTGYLVFGCPYLPSASSLSSQPGGWSYASATVWQENGKPIVYFYGATWCPYCSASSWAIWRALSEFGSVSGTYPSYSYGPPEGITYIPEMVLAYASVTSTTISFQVSQYVAGSDGVFPATSNCYQQAYVSSYSGGSIPFMVVNGVYIHYGASLVNPVNLQPWSNGENGGYTSVQTSVTSEGATSVPGGNPWSYISGPCWWLMAYIAKSDGATPQNLASQSYYANWSSATRAGVAADLAQIG